MLYYGRLIVEIVWEMKYNYISTKYRERGQKRGFMIDFGNDWNEVLGGEFHKEYYKILRSFLKGEYSSETIYPAMGDIFNAFKETPYKDVKIVIVGQDPYHQPRQAHGMCFSVQKGIMTPASLKNIYKEL